MRRRPSSPRYRGRGWPSTDDDDSSSSSRRRHGQLLRFSFWQKFNFWECSCQLNRRASSAPRGAARGTAGRIPVYIATSVAYPYGSAVRALRLPKCTAHENQSATARPTGEQMQAQHEVTRACISNPSSYIKKPPIKRMNKHGRATESVNMRGPERPHALSRAPWLLSPFRDATTLGLDPRH